MEKIWLKSYLPVFPPKLTSVHCGSMATATAQRVIKGGSYLCSPDDCMRYRSGARQPQDDDLGFRTVLLAPGPGEIPP